MNVLCLVFHLIMIFFFQEKKGIDHDEDVNADSPARQWDSFKHAGEEVPWSSSAAPLIALSHLVCTFLTNRDFKMLPLQNAFCGGARWCLRPNGYRLAWELEHQGSGGMRGPLIGGKKWHLTWSVENWQVSVRDHEADCGGRKRETRGHTARGSSVPAFLPSISETSVKSGRGSVKTCSQLIGPPFQRLENDRFTSVCMQMTFCSI